MELLGFLAVMIIGGLMIIPTNTNETDDGNEKIEKETE